MRSEFYPFYPDSIADTVFEKDGLAAHSAVAGCDVGGPDCSGKCCGRGGLSAIAFDSDDCGRRGLRVVRSLG